jgi:hypothetical protein
VHHRALVGDVENRVHPSDAQAERHRSGEFHDLGIAVYLAHTLEERSVHRVVIEGEEF